MTGTVTRDGKPLADGEIFFISAADKSADSQPGSNPPLSLELTSEPKKAAKPGR